MNNFDNQLTDIPIHCEKKDNLNELSDIQIDDGIGNDEQKDDEQKDNEQKDDEQKDDEQKDNKIQKTTDSLKRTVVKSLIWRVIAIVSTILLAVLLYNDLEKATMLGVIDNLIKLFLHFIFELAFNRWAWGLVLK